MFSTHVQHVAISVLLHLFKLDSGIGQISILSYILDDFFSSMHCSFTACFAEITEKSISGTFDLREY